MNWRIEFDPLIPFPSIVVLACAAALLTFIFLATRMKGTWVRFAAYALLALILMNPSLREEVREPSSDIVAVVVDESASQNIDSRAERRDQAVEELRRHIAELGGVETRIVRTGSNAEQSTSLSDNHKSGTHLFKALQENLTDVPNNRLGGVIFLTDGQIHDAPKSAAAIGIDAPIHTILTGRHDERDRKLTMTKAPRFGIVGQTLEFVLRVDDFGVNRQNEASFSIVRVDIAIDGEPFASHRLPTGEDQSLEVNLTHGGESIVEISVESLDQELTLINNSTVLSVNGIRDRLRVLLVSGEPHAGERTWRDLLKADPSVDLVHFTILRPPEKQDGTPTNELSLIAFPTRQLFSQKLEEFDLIIFDRYRRRGVLPIIYLANIARYVENGGALLAAAGPSFASPYSLFRTPLAEVLPARPSGEIVSGGYRPKVSELGLQHPVTANLTGANRPQPNGKSRPDWGRWFRLIGADRLSGDTLMTGAKGRPLLILDHYGEGRIAQLLSDHAWLWTRGYEGGGPQAELLRRLAHWLMKEPELEEEDLNVQVDGRRLLVTRQTMGQSVPLITTTAPDGREYLLALDETQPGRWTGELDVEDIGLYRVTDGDLVALAAVGPLNPREFADIRTTSEKMEPLARDTKGGIFWMADTGVPKVRMVKPERRARGISWLGIRENNQYVVMDTRKVTLVSAPLALLLTLGLFLLAWRREAD